MKSKLLFLGAAFFTVTLCDARPPHLSQEDRWKIAAQHLPQSTNSAPISANLAFFLSSDRYNLFPANQFNADELICYGLLGTTTNRVWYRHFPSGNFDFHLFDENGNEVPKSKIGLNFSCDPRKPTKDELFLTKHYAGYSVDNRQGEYRRLFCPEEMFAITNKGTYELRVQIRLCVIITNNLPDLNAMLDARNVAGSGLPFADTFGILSSPPLRVKVIKK